MILIYFNNLFFLNQSNMCDYYEFSDDLYDFLYQFNTKYRLKPLYNIEVHGINTMEINICTTEDSTFEYYKNILQSHDSTLIEMIRRQLFILPSITITYNHIKNISNFEKVRDRKIGIDYICKYFK